MGIFILLYFIVGEACVPITARRVYTSHGRTIIVAAFRKSRVEDDRLCCRHGGTTLTHALCTKYAVRIRRVSAQTQDDQGEEKW